MKKVYIIGVGQIGSRHLQALKNVKIPLDIHVIDPSSQSIKTAKERYSSITGGNSRHRIAFSSSISEENATCIDLAIIATNSDIRKDVTELLLKKNKVSFLVLEKLLFQKHQDYNSINKLLRENKCVAWVNCGMRIIEFYKELKKEIRNKPICYTIIGSQFGLITNAIHYIDHMAYLNNSDDFKVDTQLLDPVPILSKRKGFLELNGTLQVYFNNGSVGIFTCFAKGDLPITVEIFNTNFRCISRENEQKAWVSRKNNSWHWDEVQATIPFQSTMTTQIAEEILNTGSCSLTPYNLSSKYHLILLEALQKFLNRNYHNKYQYYPFT